MLVAHVVFCSKARNVYFGRLRLEMLLRASLLMLDLSSISVEDPIARLQSLFTYVALTSR
jgi:hypothetical protein